MPRWPSWGHGVFRYEENRGLNCSDSVSKCHGKSAFFLNGNKKSILTIEPCRRVFACSMRRGIRGNFSKEKQRVTEDERARNRQTRDNSPLLTVRREMKERWRREGEEERREERKPKRGRRRGMCRVGRKLPYEGGNLSPLSWGNHRKQTWNTVL